MLEKGVTVSGYRIDGVLGVGGMGVVYEATQLSLERTVALKLISADLGADEGFRERFRREGMIQAAIDHPHIVPVYEAGEADQGLFIAMRLIRGRNLKDLIVGNELTPRRTTHLLTQVAEALDSAHEVGLIHRDIKPYNILVDDRRDHAYLADFGVTKARSRPNLTKTGQMVGTLDYMAPEQIRGQSATEQTDIYALGCVLYECFTGTVPFYRETDAAVLYAHLSEPLPSVRDHRENLPAGLDEVLSRAMAKKPEDRYETAVALLRETARAVTPPAAPTAAPAPAQDTAPGASGPVTVLAPGGDGSPATVAPSGQDTEAPASPETVLAGAAGTVAPAERSPTEAPAGPETMLAGATPVPETEAPTGPGTVLAGATPVPETEAPTASPETVLGAEAIAGTAAGAGPPGVSTPLPPTEFGEPVSAPPAREAAAPARAGGGPGVAVLIGAIVVVAAVLGVAGYFVGHSTGGGSTSSANAASSDTISSGKATVAFPSGWSRDSSPPKIPGLDLTSVSGLARAQAGTAGLLLGSLDPKGAFGSFLPLAFRQRIPASAVNGRSVVRLGSLQGFRYATLKPKGFKGVVTLYVVPQQNGSSTVVGCYATAGAIPRDCASLAAGLKVAGAKPFVLTLPTEYARTLNHAVSSVHSVRTANLAAMRKAASAKVQARAARSIAAAYGAAAKSMDAADATAYIAPVNRGIATAFRGADNGYTALANAAAAKSASRYNRARRLVSAQEARVRVAIAQLQKLGFNVQS